MKQIKINKISEPDVNSVFVNRRCYSVWLGNGVKRSFKGKYKALEFMASVNAELNLCLSEIVAIHVDIYREYWDTWHYDIPACSTFADIEKLINMCVERSGMQNGNYFVFINMLKCTEMNRNICMMLLDVRLQKNHYTEVRKLQAIILRIDMIEDKIKRIGAI